MPRGSVAQSARSRAIVAAYEGWRGAARAGSCGETRAGAGGDCAHGDKGVLRGGVARSWQWSSLRALTISCLHACAACGRCKYISVSLLYVDCSWYHRCDVDHLPSSSTTRSHLSGPVSAQLLETLGVARPTVRTPLMGAPEPPVQLTLSADERAAVFAADDVYAEDPTASAAFEGGGQPGHTGGPTLPTVGSPGAAHRELPKLGLGLPQMPGPGHTRWTHSPHCWLTRGCT